MSEKTETTNQETNTSEVSAPIEQEPKIEEAEEPKAEPEVEAKVEEVKEHIEVVASDAPLNVSQKTQQAEHSEKTELSTETETLTEQSKSKESTAEVAVNDESLKVEAKSEQTTSEEITEDKVVTKKTARGRVSRTAKSGTAVSTETLEVVEEKKPVELKSEEKKPELEDKQEDKSAEPVVDTPKRGRGRQPKRKAVSPVEKTETKKAKNESPQKQDDTQIVEEDKTDKDVPLLEQSLTVEGKRQRKTTQRLELNVKESTSKHSYTPQGKGKALGDIPRISHFIDKSAVNKMRNLHKICTGYIPKLKEIKKTLKAFNGFEFDRDSDEFEKKSDSLQKLNVSGLKQMCELLDLDRSGTKEVICKRIMEFLMAPVDSGRPVPAPKPRGRSKGRPKGQTKKSDNDGSMDLDESEQSEDENESSKSDLDESKEQEENDEKDEPAEENGHEKDTQPPLKAPTEDELKNTIKEIIDKANLDKVTMKKVIQDVYARYPDHNLNDQKNLIKRIVKELLEVQ